MTKNFTKKAKEALESSKSHAERLGHTYIGSEHLLLGIMCTECVASKLLDDKKVLYTDIYDSIVRISGLGTKSPLVYCSFTPKCRKILESSSALATKFNGSFIGSEHILHSICDNPDCVGAKILVSLGVNLQSLKTEICSFLEMGSDSIQGTNNGLSGAPNLSLYGVNLTALAKKGLLDPVLERDTELKRIIQILSRRTKNNPCLIGEPGVGKTAIAEGLALLIAKGEIAEPLSGKIIFSLDISSMVAGAKYRGDFEERMRLVLNEVKSNPSVILFIDEIHTIIGAGSAEGAVDAANIIKPALARGAIRVIGATTIDEYRKYIEKDAALERRFQPVTVNEPSKEQTVRILNGLKEKYETHHGVKITDSAINAAVELSSRYICDRFLPDKAIDLIDEACSAKKLSVKSSSPEIMKLEQEIKELSEAKEDYILQESFEEASEIRDRELSCKIELNRLRSEYCKGHDSVIQICEEDIRESISLWTNIPVSRLEHEERDRLLTLKDRLSERIIGQNEAIEATVNSIKRGRLGLKNPKRPIGSFLFLGPTGVGKTALAINLSKELFPDRESLIRLDMSEYAEKHTVSKLIGSPPGYVGYDEGGTLTDKVRKNPYTVVLFDEIEKAHKDIYSVLLQILDDGVLTDSHSRKVDFKNCIIILTSNIGADALTEPKRLGFSEKSDTESDKSAKSEVKSRLKSYFSPEFLNRLDEIVIFDKLSRSDAEKITKNILNEVKELTSNMGICIDFTEALIKHITEIGYDKIYGARPIRRAVSTYIENPISDMLLTEDIKIGDSILIDFDKEISFKTKNIKDTAFR
ncbi:MAG: ATP-dependent Clp protease ATP-binding subunit [Clostridia bacterium]|nr:ATP-dependent Clp protease ATP-binding subunit [Clostridia bacterium]